jgi:hypothetical protein
VLFAALDGVRQAGVPARVEGCDLTDRRMYVRVVCEEVRALAPALLGGYRSPFTGAAGADCPVVFAGFVISNSETGCGAFTLTPRLVVQVCGNGRCRRHGLIMASAVSMSTCKDPGRLLRRSRDRPRTTMPRIQRPCRRVPNRSPISAPGYTGRS